MNNSTGSGYGAEYAEPELSATQPVQWIEDGRSWSINEKLIALAIALVFVAASLLLIGGAK